MDENVVGPGQIVKPVSEKLGVEQPHGGPRLMVRDSDYNGEVAYLATMHRKERAIAPILGRSLGIRVQVTAGLNTDQFGTFRRDVARQGSQLDAARAKIAATFARSPHARLAIASEGRFEPHPNLPLVFLASEVIVFTDRHYDLEVIGRHVSSMTNYAHAVVTRVSEAMSFAKQAGFPGHGILVSGCRDGQSAPWLGLFSDISSVAQLAQAVQRILDDHDAAFVEADMRAHRNPTRMKAIEAATRDLVRRYRCRCPVCARPGFEIIESVPGTLCAQCGHATDIDILTCWGCGHRLERAVPKPQLAAPSQCLYAMHEQNEGTQGRTRNIMGRMDPTPDYKAACDCFWVHSQTAAGSM